MSADRLSGWTEQVQIQPSSSHTGAKGLCSALRKLFMTFGVPVEVSRDGELEFAAAETKAFFQKWGVRHRISPSYLSSSNGIAELAVKAVKRLLMDNIDSQGHLDTDKVVRALLIKRNTPDPGCNLSPSEVLFGHKLHDTLPYIRKDVKLFENDQIANQWKEAWRLKEESLKTHYAKTMKKLHEHSRPLPPLHVADQVLIQNQCGQHPTRWDRSGTVVDVGQHDQYYVKVAGTGHITLRNRRYLQKYQPHLLHGIGTATSPTPTLQGKSSDEEPSTPAPGRSTLLPIQPSVPTTIACPTHPGERQKSTTNIKRLHMENLQSSDSATHARPSESATANTDAQPQHLTAQSSDSATHTQPSESTTANPDVQPRRSTRVRTTKKFYDPESGTYISPTI